VLFVVVVTMVLSTGLFKLIAIKFQLAVKGSCEISLADFVFN